jgi:hypothetical protein
MSRADFYKVFEKLFQILGKGDILDLIRFFDPQNSGYIDIHDVANAINMVVERQNPDLCLKLTSEVAALVDEVICDEIIPSARKLRFERPKGFERFFVDVLSAVISKRVGTLEQWLNMFGQQNPGYLVITEWQTAMIKLEVQGGKK